MPPKPRPEVLPPTRLLLEIARKEEEPARTPVVADCPPARACRARHRRARRPGLPADRRRRRPAAARCSSSSTTAGRRRRAGRPWSRRRTASSASPRSRAGRSLSPRPPSRATSRSRRPMPRRRRSASTRWCRGPTPPTAPALLPALDDARPRRRPSAASPGSPTGSAAATSTALREFLEDKIGAPTIVYADTSSDLFGLKPPVGNADALDRAGHPPRTAGCRPAGSCRASDIKGRVIGDAPFTFAAGATAAEAKFTLPVELRNDIVRLDVVGAETAGAVQLLDERWRRRRIGLLSGASPTPRSRCSRRSTTSRAPSSPSPTCASRARRTPPWRCPN